MDRALEETSDKQARQAGDQPAGSAPGSVRSPAPGGEPPATDAGAARTGEAESAPAPVSLATKIFKSFAVWDVLLLSVPLAFYFSSQHMHILTFFSACVGIIPLAGWMGRATEYIADRMGDGPGGLMNATFGNACEFIIALAALRAGYVDIVKASITGSIIGNILLVLGASMLAGGLKHQTQIFNRTTAMTSATLLALAAISLTVPAIFHHFCTTLQNEDDLALGISVILFATYVLSLLFTLRTHKHLYTRKLESEEHQALGVHGWSMPTSVTVLLVATVMVAVLSELLVHGVDKVAHELGLNQVFIGVILVAVIGNAAEHSTAIIMAVKNKMDLAMNIALGSGAQIALLIAPILVFVSFAIGKPMDLRFTEFEVLSVAVSVIILGYVTADGECNWLEGVQLLAVYLILGAAFFYM